ncbi:MAG: hypothetical protein NTV57_03890 [Cyanobacteria bacterium]|nr:hypothetical protein [Cyanobacteriota bacterium]
MNAPPPPNNLGPTLLLAIGLLSSPLLVGVPLVIVALAAVRTTSGDPALPRLNHWLQRLQRTVIALAPAGPAP